MKMIVKIISLFVMMDSTTTGLLLEMNQQTQIKARFPL